MLVLGANGKASRPKQGKNYVSLEDSHISKAWLCCLLNSKTGTDQISDDFYNQVKTQYKSFPAIALALANGTIKPQAASSIKNRFSTISASVSKFIGCMRKIEALKISGDSPADTLQKAV